MKTTYPEIKHVHHDTSLSAFATGLFIGTLATLILATEEGRAAGKKLLDAVKQASKDYAPELEKLEQNIDQVFNPLDRLHRTTPPTSPTFHRGGEPLR